MSKNKMVFYWVIIIVAVVALVVVTFDTARAYESYLHRVKGEKMIEARDYYIQFNVAAYSVCMFAIVASTVGLFLERYGKKRDVPQCCDKKDDNNEVVNS